TANGLALSQGEGVGAVGDIASLVLPHGFRPYHRGQIDTTVFLELLGLAPEREAGLLAAARQHVAVPKVPRLTRGLSPHAPYTVGPQLLRQVCTLSCETRSALAMHVAESREELELLHSHSGPLVQMLQSLGAWHPD